MESVNVVTYNLSCIVQTKSLGQHRAGNVEHRLHVSRQQESMENAGIIHEKARHHTCVVDACGLRDGWVAKQGCQITEGSTHLGERKLIPGIVLPVTSGFVAAVDAQKLGEISAVRIIDRVKDAADIREAMGCSGIIDVETGGIAGGVDPDDLRLRRTGEVLGSEVVGQNQGESVVRNYASIAPITCDGSSVINPQQLGKRRVVWVGHGLEAIGGAG